MLNFLPPFLKERILNNFTAVFEVRIKIDKPIIIKGIKRGEIATENLNYKISKEFLEKAILNLSNYSVYSVEESLRRGFITSNDGERVGVLGTCVLRDKEVVTIRDFTSICVRIPHDVVGCSSEYFKSCEHIRNCLVISKPFHGKTTFIRDLGRNYAKHHDVLFVDERDELSANGKFDLGKNTDVIRYSTKKFGFYNGVRSYNPEIIVCDELMSEEDCEGVNFALLSGVKIIASVHADNIENLLKKQYLSLIFKNRLIEDIIVLDNFKPMVIKEGQWSKFLPA